jgi:hypothetical protein
MYQCERCRGTFQFFQTPGQCPLCKTWASVRCDACRHIAPASVFIDAGNMCPRCGRAVYIVGAAPTRRPAPPYPVTFEADYTNTRSRLTTLFRPLLVIPHAILTALWAIGVLVAVVIAWFALLFTGRWPPGTYDFVTRFTRYTTRVYGYLVLLCDQYPPFDGAEHADYPVRLNVGPVLPEYNRVKVLLRILYMIPALVVLELMSIFLEFAVFAAWIIIVVTGRMPKGLFDALRVCVSYVWRAVPLCLLLTESYPPIADSRERFADKQAVAV